jgi:alpha-glucosidase
MSRFAIAILLASCLPAVELKSPDGRLIIDVQTIKDKQPSEEGQLVYSVSFRGKPVITQSVLRLELQGQRPLGAAVRIAGTTPSTENSTYKLVTGKVSVARNHYNALRIDLDESGPFARKLSLEARAFDDAVAFRYVVPEQPLLRELRLSKETTEFRLSADATAWCMILPNYRSMYESEFYKMSVSSLSNQGGVASSMLVGLPVLLELPGVAWVAITEADVRDYAAMYLVNPSASWTGHWFESRLSPDPNDPDLAVTGTLPKSSPWRVLLIADAPGRLIESTVITSLNPESVIKDTSWIRAGRASWDWWSGSIGAEGKPAYTIETMKHYVDFAAASGLEYMLVDAGWSPMNDITKMNGRVDIPELVKYASAKNVKVFIWLHWSGVDRQLEEAFPLYEKWGVAGVKIDFMSRDDQRMMQWYYRVAAKAAQHHLMVDYHGSTKPSGMERMYPNVVGYEAVLGLEQSKAGTRDNPESHVTLPFTRMIAGPMDYTPGAFDNQTREGFVARMQRPMALGTRAHQLAMYVVFEAPIQMVADHPAAYKDQPAFDFIRKTPATWDETRVLAGYPGDYIVMARRSGESWFIGAMTDWNARTIEIPLSFLGPGNYTAEIYADSADANTAPKNVSITRQPVTSAGKLRAVLAGGGGYAVRLAKAR